MDTDWYDWLAEGLVGNGCQYLSIALEEGTDHVQNLVNRVAERYRFPLKAESTISEKIGYEIALTYSYGKKRSAFLTHGFSLPIAMDPLMSSIYTGVAGGFIVIALDATPALPYSSHCDPVSLSMFAKMPVLEPADFSQLPEIIKQAYALSEAYETPIMLHIDSKIPGGNHAITRKTGKRRKADFEKNPARWAATPRFRFLLHKKLNQRLREISESDSKTLTRHIAGKNKEIGIICNHSNLSFIQTWAKRHELPVLSVQMPFPLPVKPISQFISDHHKVLLIEDRFPTIQFQLPERRKILGRLTDARFQGEFTWQQDGLLTLLDGIRTGKEKDDGNTSSLPKSGTPGSRLAKFLNGLKAGKTPARLVADKTPNTIDLPADYFVSRGGAISFAAGCSHAGTSEFILSITDSAALLHYGIQATTNAIYNTSSVKCLLLIQPEHAKTIQKFFNGMEHVRAVPLNLNAKNNSKKIKEPSSQPVTFYTVSTEETA